MKQKRAKETMLLVVLVIIFACYGFYALLLSPKMAEAADLKKRVSFEDARMRSLYNSVLQYREDSAELKKIYAEIDGLSAQFYLDTHNEDYLDDLDAALKNNGVNYVSIVAKEHEWLDLSATTYRCNSPYLAYADKSEYELAALKEDGMELEALIELVQEAAASPETDQFPMTVKLTGPYRNVEALVTSLNKARRNIISCAMSITPADGEQEISKTTNPQVAAELELQFVRLSTKKGNNLGAEFSDMPQEFVMPDDFVSGSYRDVSLLSLLSNLF